ncbi:MAG TPA: alpha/beta hydrolase [Syntrophorhabdaceae bacterium]|nr:alpha/beta hydrolase [Syntrophorhabdaceae bacterium]
MPDYTKIDKPSVLTYVFYPREESGPCPKYAFDGFVQVADDAAVHCRFYKENDAWPWLLFFHGNGEVASDYDEIALFYFKYSLNIVVADYRGYGKSTGIPTVGSISQDAHKVYDSVKEQLKGKGLRDDLCIMGRSLGSISAFEIACRQGSNINGLIIESGFPSISSLIIRHGIAEADMDLEAITGECLAMLKTITIPVLIIHGEYDTLVPSDEAETILENIGSRDKEFLLIPGATHNDIMFVGLRQYMEAIRKFVEKTASAR